MTESTKKEDEIMDLTWGCYKYLVGLVAKQIEPGRYTHVYGVPRGGLIPAVMLSHRLGLKLLVDLPFVKPKVSPMEILVVDDLVDSGRTLLHCSYDTATLLVKPDSSVKPKYFGAVTSKIVIFPYENKKEVMDRYGE